MIITALDEYALRFALQLASQKKLTSAPELANIEGVSVEYARKILYLMRQAGLVEAERGREGGFHLCLPPEQVTVEMVLKALTSREDQLGYYCNKFRGHEEDCIYGTECAVRPVWQGLSSLLTKYLSQITLADLMNKTEKEITHSLHNL